MRRTLEAFDPGRTFDVVLLVMALPNLGSLDRAFARVRALLAADGEAPALVTAFSTSPRQWEVRRVDCGPREYAVLLDHPRGVLADVIRDPTLYADAAARQGLATTRSTSPPYELLRFRHA